MNRILSVSLILVFLFPFDGQAQEWVKKFQDPQSNFYETQKAFRKHFKKFEKERSLGTRRNAEREEEEEIELAGYNVFKRWEYRMEPRVYPSGMFPDPLIVYREMSRFQQANFVQAQKPIGNWTPMGPSVFQPSSHGEGIARVNSITVDPFNNQHIFASSASGGLWETTNGGNSWSNTTDQLQTLGFGSTVVDYTNPLVIYAASGDGEYGDAYGLGVLKSTDGGQTWNLTGLNWSNFKNRVARKIIMDPTDHLVLLVSTDGGIYRSTDGAVSWTKVSNSNVFDIEFNPSDNQVVYAAGDRFYKSTDNGQSFSNITSGLPSFGAVNRLAMAVTAANDNYVYLLAADASSNGFYGLYRSTDKGSTFSLRSNSPNVMGWDVNGSDNGGQSFYTLSICASPQNAEVIFTGGVNIWKSDDGGSNLYLCAHWYGGGGAPYVHADIHDMAYHGSELYASSDGGVFVSGDDGNSWQYISEGLQATQFYRMGGSEQVPNTIYAGAQDNQSSRYQNGLWQKVRGGDGMEQAISPVNSNIVYSCLQNGGLARSTNGGNSFTDITSGLTGSGGWVTPFAVDPAGILYVGYGNLFRSTTNGSTYSAISPGGGTIVALAIAQNNPSWIYFSRGTSIYRTSNAGVSWTDISSGLPVTFALLTYIAVDPDNEQRLWVSFSGYSNGNKVFYSGNGGASWSNVSGNLPNLPVNTIAIQKNSQDGIYAGTDAGVFFRNNNFNNWQPFMSGLPNVQVDELEINYAAGKIRAATYGRGLWESDLYTETAPVADFTENRKVICPGQDVTFSDLSLNDIISRTWSFPGGTPSFSTLAGPVVQYTTPGLYDVTLTVANTSGADSITKTTHILVTPNLQTVPLLEGFEGNTLLPASWSMSNPGLDMAWQQSTQAGGFGSSNKSAYFDNYHATNNKEKDAITTANYDISSMAVPALAFDVAYGRQSPTVKDSLIVEISTDCGDTYQEIYSRGGYTLKTTNTYYNAPFIPLPWEWRKEVISLSAYSGQTNISFRFINKTAIGNNIYVDNINLAHGATVQDNSIGEGMANVMPNPFSGQATLSFTSPAGPVQGLSLNIFDLAGKEILTLQVPVAGNENRLVLDGTKFSKGMYLFKLSEGKRFIRAGKFVVE